MRLADADLLPFEFNNFSDTMQTYVKELKNRWHKNRAKKLSSAIANWKKGVFAAMTDPRVKSVPPAKEIVSAVPEFCATRQCDRRGWQRASAEYRKAH